MKQQITFIALMMSGLIALIWGVVMLSPAIGTILAGLLALFLAKEVADVSNESTTERTNDGA